MKSVEEATKIIENMPMRPYFRLHYSFMRVISILDFAKLIEKYGEELSNEYHHKIVASKGNLKPSSELLDYIMLEIYNFYKNVEVYNKKGANLPIPPAYANKELRIFRNLVGHRDDRHKFSTLKAWMEEHIKIEQNIGSDRIIKEFKEYYKNALPLLLKGIKGVV